MYSPMPPQLNLITESQRSTFESNRSKKQLKSYRMFSPLNTLFRTQKDREDLGNELDNAAFDDTGELCGWDSQDENPPSSRKTSRKRSEGTVDSYRRFRRLLKPIGFGIPEIAIISPMGSYKGICSARSVSGTPSSCEKPGHFVNIPKYHIFSNLNIDFQPFRIVTFKIDEDNIWFKVLDPVGRRLLLDIETEAELEKNELDLFCQEEKFEVFEDIQHVIVSDITIQSSKDREIFQLTSRKGQFILEAGSRQEKREFINLIRFAIEAKLVPLLSNRMLILEGPSLLEQLFLLKFGKKPEGDTSPTKGNFVHKIGDVAGKCLDYGRKIHILQELIDEKQRNLDDILGDLQELDEREKELTKSLRAAGRSLELSQQLESVENNLKQSVARVDRALRRVHEKEDVIAGNQSILGSIKTTLDITELPEDTKSSWLWIIAFAFIGFILALVWVCI